MLPRDMFRYASRTTRRLQLLENAFQTPAVHRFSSGLPAAAMPMMCDTTSSLGSTLSKRRRSQSTLQHSSSAASSMRAKRITVGPTKTSLQRFSTSSTESPTQQTKTFLVSLGYSTAISDGIIDALLQNGIPSTSLLGMVKSLAGRYEVDEDGGLKALAASVKLELEKEDGKPKVKVWCLPSTGWTPITDSTYYDDIKNEVSDDDQLQNQLPIVTSMERAFAVEATEGTTLTDVAEFGTSDNCDVLGEYLECACSGIMACSTCHVVIHPDWFDATIPQPADDDSDDPNDIKDTLNNHPNKIGPPCEAEQDMIDLAYEPQLTSRLGCQIKLTKELDGLVILLPRGSNNLMDFVPFE